ncbi:MAG: GNAT family N-acetyltransferase [Amaricoccus sp.]
MTLVRPGPSHLPSYVAALRSGWSPDNLRPEAAADQLAAIEADAGRFLAAIDDRDPRGATVTLPDGSLVPRLPWLVRWMWDEGFVGSINLRWQQGSNELPPRILGHIGFSVIPAKRRQGHATRALGLMLEEARAVGLAWVELTADPDNAASLRTIEQNGGVLVERFEKAPAYGGGASLRYRIGL